MTFPNLLSNAVKIYLKTRLIWLFAAVFALYSVITALMPSSTGTVDPEASLRLLPLICGIDCLLLLFLPVMLFSSCGTVYTAAQVSSGQPVTLRGTWERFKQRLLALFLLTLAFIGIAVVLVVILMVIVVGASLAGALDTAGTQNVTIVVMTILILPVSLIIGLGYVALMLDPQGGFDAITRGAKIFWRRAGILLLTFVLYLLSFSLLQVLFSLLFYAVFDPAVLQSLPSAGIGEIYIRLMGSLPSKLLTIVLMPVVAPIYLIMLALIYQDASRDQQPAPVSAVEPV